MSQHINQLIAQLVNIEAHVANCKQAVAESPAGQALAEAEKVAEEMRQALKEALKDDPVSIRDTDFGRIGWEPRRTVTHSPAAVRELAPDLVPFVITEAVDKKTLETMVKATIKAGKAPENLLAQLEERAEVKETQAWISKLAMPTAVEA